MQTEDVTQTGSEEGSLIQTTAAEEPAAACCCGPGESCGDSLETTGYPSREEAVRAWEALAAEIAAAPLPTEESCGCEGACDKTGSLTVIGSGIESVGFTRDAEAAIKAADKVFFCVADPATIIWIRKLRPDAYDLYVFYDDSKPRYHTYMQRSEAMLHPVRQGESVVAIYYGHPGVFVLSTHRSIAIARREGYRARMKAGISALDCLCADLGVDPCHPGLVTHEATDMLIRRRDPDTSLHVVLWQVGLIGQMGFRRMGFVNDKFQILVEYLQSFYGEDYPVTHYLAARYPTLEPTVEVHTLSGLLDPAVQEKITGLSTFYLAPKDARETDADMALRLGLIKPGQEIGPGRPVREIANYGPRELRALKGFAGFKVPDDFQHQPLTRAGEFLIELTDDPELAETYVRNPERAVDDEVFPGLSSKEKQALARRHEGAIQLATKGSRAVSPPRDQLILALLRDRKLCIDLQRTIRSAIEQDRLGAELSAWIRGRGFEIRLGDLFAAVRGIDASLLLPWTGAYYDRDADLMLAIMGAPVSSASLIAVNGEILTGITFYNGALAWRRQDGNPHSGLLHFDLRSLTHGPRAVSGTVTFGGEAGPRKVRFDGRDLETLELSKQPTAAGGFHAEYTAVGLDWQTSMVRSLAVDQDSLNVGGTAVPDYSFTDGELSWTDTDAFLGRGRLRFLTDPICGLRFFFGKAGEDVAKTNFCGYAPAVNGKHREAPPAVATTLSPIAWQTLRQISDGAIRERLTPFWNEWQKTRFTTQVIHRSLLGLVSRLARTRTEQTSKS